jgi:hypothetical protein
MPVNTHTDSQGKANVQYRIATERLGFQHRKDKAISEKSTGLKHMSTQLAELKGEACSTFGM